MTVQLGDKVRDRISGFEGIVIGITEYLYGCRRPFVQPTTLTSDGKPLGAEAFDEPQLEVLERSSFQPVAENEPAPTKTGGPRSAPARVDAPRR
jgi:hypothetical protein